MAFGPDGKLYVANGDGTSFGRVDPRTSRVQSLDSLSGKILRVDPITGDGLADNPFYNGDPDCESLEGLRLRACGIRSALRSIRRRACCSSATSAGPRGKRSTRGRGKNFGWPWYEGGSGVSLQTGGYRDLAEAQAFYATNPDVQAPLWSRRHAAGARGDRRRRFLHRHGLPDELSQRAVPFRLRRQPASRAAAQRQRHRCNSVTPLSLNVGGVVEMTMGRDGCMYYVDLINGTVGRLMFTPAGAR